MFVIIHFKRNVSKKLMSSEQTQKELLNFIRSLQKQVEKTIKYRNFYNNLY